MSATATKERTEDGLGYLLAMLSSRLQGVRHDITDLQASLNAGKERLDEHDAARDGMVRMLRYYELSIEDDECCEQFLIRELDEIADEIDARFPGFWERAEWLEGNEQQRPWRFRSETSTETTALDQRSRIELEKRIEESKLANG